MKASQEKQKLEQVIQLVAPRSKFRRAWQMKGGISAHMVAVETEGPDGLPRRMIVRWPNNGQPNQDPQAVEKEYRLLSITNALGLATPIPYLFDQSGEIFSAPYLVIEYIEGQMEFAPSDLEDYILQLATQLAKIHNLDCSNLDLSFLPKNGTGCHELNRNRSAQVGPLWDEGRIRETLASIWPLPPANGPGLLHGDFWPGNTLWLDGQLVAVIDWEDACIGDPLIDLAISRLDIGWIFGIEAMDAFTNHYQSLMAIDVTNLPYWDLCAALRLVRLASPDLAGWLAYFRPYGRLDITEQTLRDHYQCFISRSFEELAKQPKVSTEKP